MSANLASANLYQAYLYQANLTSANLTNANWPTCTWTRQSGKPLAAPMEPAATPTAPTRRAAPATAAGS